MAVTATLTGCEAGTVFLLSFFPCADVRRATAIMESILAGWDDTAERFSQTWEEEADSMLAVQGMLDVMKSPLFSALVDIREQCKRVSEAG